MAVFFRAKNEEDFRKYEDEMMNRAVDLLMDVLAIPSVNGKDDEGRIAEYLCAYFQRQDIFAEVHRRDDSHANVYACLEGENKERAILWNGHLDTVPYGNVQEWNTDPKKPVIINHKIFGRGASDMKSGLCAMVFALCEYKKSGKRIPYTIHFAGTCDEEKNGLGARMALEGLTKKTFDSILIAEPTGLKMGIAQKGCIWLEISVNGKTSHGAYPEEGCNAVAHGFQFASHLKERVETYGHPVLGKATANITKMDGGIAPNMIPDRAAVMMDIRLVPSLTEKKLLDIIEDVTAIEEGKAEGRLKIRCRLVNSRRAIEAPDKGWLKERLYKSADRERLIPETVGIHFFTDASILAEKELGTEVLLFGPGEPNMAHKPNEYVEIEKYEKSVRIFTELIGME